MATKTIDELKKIFESEDVYIFSEQSDKKGKRKLDKKDVDEVVTDLTKNMKVMEINETTPHTKIDIETMKKIGISPSTIYKYAVLSPTSKEIVREGYKITETITEKNKFLLREYINDFYKDYEYFQKLNKYEDYDDPSYEDIDIYRYSKYYEFLVSKHMKCVYCDKKLLPFVNPNMPVVDLMCENVAWHLEHNAPQYYQVKISKAGNYFSRAGRFISAGSRRFGEAVHRLSSNDDNFNLIPNYICILVDEKMRPIKSGSFGLFYDIAKKDDEIIFDYNLAGNITWNNENVKYDLDDKFDIFIDDIYKYFSENINEILGDNMEIMKNPFKTTLRKLNFGGYYYKYLKYKTKYNNLKKQLL